MPLFTVTHRIAGVERTNQVSVVATTPKECRDEIATALAGDFAGITPDQVEILDVVSAEKPKALKGTPEPETKPEPTPEATPPAPVETPAAEETPAPPEAEKPKAQHARKHG